MRKFESWVIPFLISIGLFIIIRPVLAQTGDVLKDVQVGSEVKDGFSRIYYLNGGSKIFVSQENQNSKQPNSKGEYITWVTEVADRPGQIFLYNLSNASLIQLTFSGNNNNPQVDEKGRVVWEGWDGKTWQIFFFDGKSTRQLTIGDTSLNPSFYQEYISYGRRDVTDTWRAVVFSIADDKSIDVTTGENAKNPEIKDGIIYLGESGETFPLSVSDLFLLNLQPLTATGSATPATVSAEITTVLEELNATPSGVPEIPLATESGNLPL